MWPFWYIVIIDKFDQVCEFSAYKSGIGYTTKFSEDQDRTDFSIIQIDIFYKSKKMYSNMR